MTAIKSSLLVMLLILLIQCGKQDSYNPDSQLTATEKNALMMQIVRNAAKAPENVGPDEKFDARYDDYYRQRATQSHLELYYIDGDTHYFLLSQPAPSLVEKRNATGGKLILDSQDKLKEYEEVFRTWKMVPDTLKQRSFILFDKMVKGESLEPFLTKNSKIEYIEFPDEHTVYNKSERAWQVRP